MNRWWVAGGSTLVGFAVFWLLRESDAPRAVSPAHASRDDDAATADVPAHVATRRAELESAVEAALLHEPEAKGRAIVRGVVIDPDERAIPDVEVHLWVDGGPAVETRTAADGAFAIEPPAVGPVSLSFFAKTHVPATWTNVGVRDELRVVLLPGVRVSARVLDARTGAPIAGAVVELKSVKSIGSNAHTTTDADGRFAMALPDPTPALEVFADGYHRSTRYGLCPREIDGDLVLKLPPLEGGEPAYYRVLDADTRRAVAGVTIVPVEVVAPGYLPATVPVPPDDALEVRLVAGRAVAGRVLDADGRPAPGARIELRVVRLAADHGLDASTATRAEQMLLHGTSGVGGRFRFDGLPAGTVALDAVSNEAALVDRLRVDVGREDVEIRLLRASGVIGRVVSAEDGSPIIRFKYQKDENGGRSRHAMSTSDGFGSSPGNTMTMGIAPDRSSLVVPDGEEFDAGTFVVEYDLEEDD